MILGARAGDIEEALDLGDLLLLLEVPGEAVEDVAGLGAGAVPWLDVDGQALGKAFPERLAALRAPRVLDPGYDDDRKLEAFRLVDGHDPDAADAVAGNILQLELVLFTLDEGPEAGEEGGQAAPLAIHRGREVEEVVEVLEEGVGLGAREQAEPQAALLPGIFHGRGDGRVRQHAVEGGEEGRGPRERGGVLRRGAGKLEGGGA